MHLLLLAMIILAAQAGAQQQPPCDLVPEQELPNCYFTVRSNYGLHGRVHTLRVIRHQLSPDPRTRSKIPHQSSQKLFIQEPGVWVVFGLDGEVIENSGSLSADGSPVNPTRERKTNNGSKAVVISGTADDPEEFRTEKAFDSDGQLTEESIYQHRKLLSRHVQKRNSGSVEDITYDDVGNEIFHSREQCDKAGRVADLILIDHDRQIFHQRDSYDECGEASALIARAWLDQNGLLLGEITIREGIAMSSWRRADCGELCWRQMSLGFTFPFDRSINYDLQPDGSLLTTIEHHKGRYGNIENDDVELSNQNGTLIEKISYRYLRDQYGNWTERTTSILDPATGQMIDVRLDKRDLTYY
jgi:hypothetical protein